MVNRVRRATGLKKVGHGGTLDPFATGLLLMLVGKATRLFDFLTPLEKEYRVTLQLGAVSTTGDIEGEITPRTGAPRISETGLRRVLPEFTGVITQRAPDYSAVKVGGEALYRKARRGEKVEAPMREVEIHRLELVSIDVEKQRAVLDVACSKGTYIRSLCEDIGGRLATGGFAAALRRTAIGEFRVEGAVTPDELEEISRARLLSPGNPSFISCLGALYFLPVRQVDEKEARAVAVGRPIAGEESGPVRVVRDGDLLAVYGPAREEGFIRPLVVLA